jgi:hypothetical protein
MARRIYAEYPKLLISRFHPAADAEMHRLFPDSDSGAGKLVSLIIAETVDYRAEVGGRRRRARGVVPSDNPVKKGVSEHNIFMDLVVSLGGRRDATLAASAEVDKAKLVLIAEGIFNVTVGYTHDPKHDLWLPEIKDEHTTADAIHDDLMFGAAAALLNWTIAFDPKVEYSIHSSPARGPGE